VAGKINGRIFLADSFEATIRIQHGIAAMRRNCFAEAIGYFNAALEFQPDDPLIHWNKATSLLSLGDYIEGFKEFEWRWKMYDWRWGLLGEDIYRVQPVPQWCGESLRGKRLLFYWEMGYGDGIQQLRYVPVLRDLGAEVTVLAPRPLMRLARILDCDVIETIPEDVSGFDFRCSLFGVMSALSQTVETVSGRPYLLPVCGSPGGSRVGLVWSGRTQTEFSLAGFLLRLDLHGYELQSLQPGPCSSTVLPLPPGDFLDTALMIARMDHIITVDTAVAHLAGAMGHPSTHVLIPYCSDWRWHFGNAWYPTLKLYRQPKAGDWAEPLAMLNGALRWSSTSS
jgi:hypothetical protein